MNIIYARQPLEMNGLKSIFLAGPTPRAPTGFADALANPWTPSWRPDAIKIFERLNFNGVLLVPEDKEGSVKCDVYYEEQVDWEDDALHAATTILFWIPRNMKTMPALTTNDEWGAWKQSGKVVLGVPPEAEKCKYQIHFAKKYNVEFADTLEQTVKNAMAITLCDW